MVRKLGQSGIGSVYEVEHMPTPRQRALEVLSPELSRDAQRIGNPHIGETFEAGRPSEMPTSG